MNINFERVAQAYAAFRPQYPALLIDKLLRIPSWGADRVGLDLGAGAANLTTAVTPFLGMTIALEKSRTLASIARENLHGVPGASCVVVGRAECLPFRRGSFDWIFAAQAWHLFNRRLASAESRRVLRVGGRLAIVYFSRLEIPGSVVAVTHALIRQFNPRWRHGGVNGLYPAFLAELHETGFTAIETFSFDVAPVYSMNDWLGRIVASKGVGASLSPEIVSDFEGKLRDSLSLYDFSFPIAIPHRVFCIIAASKASE